MITRRRYTKNFTTIGNELFEDDRLAADEVGVIAYLLSRPDNWEVRRPALARRWKMGREKIARIMFNLIRYGWIVARRDRLPNGTFFVVYEVLDGPGPALTIEETRAAIALVPADPEGSETDAPDTGEPDTAQPDTANPPAPIYEDSTNTDSPKTESTKGACAFAQIRERWPPDKVLSAVTAERAWLRLPDGAREACRAGIAPYLADCKAQKRIVCDLKTYIEEQRWERVMARPKAVNAAGKVEIKLCSPQWYRWRDYKLAMGESVAWMERHAAQYPHSVWLEPSEWPPPLPRAGPPEPESEDEAAEFSRAG